MVVPGVDIVFYAQVEAAAYILLLLLCIIWRVQPCGYDALVYRLRTPSPVSFLRPFFFLGSQCGEVLLFCLWICPPLL